MTEPRAGRWLGEPYVGKPLSATAYAIDEVLAWRVAEGLGDGRYVVHHQGLPGPPDAVETAP